MAWLRGEGFVDLVDVAAKKKARKVTGQKKEQA